MDKHPCRYTSEDIVDLESRLLRASAEADCDNRELLREAAGVLCNLTVRIATIRQAIQ